ncbi:MAG: E3 binding domain-containing protein, partial [Amphritea sp.]|nr:E3 binding domain-containing protein [Amphritea sp.]
MNESMSITLPADALEGTVAKVSEWLVTEGQSVKKGAPLLELETDKVTMEVCAEIDGTMAKIIATPGEQVGEETILGFINSRDKSAPENSMSRDPVSEEKTSLPNDKEIVEIKLATDQLEGTTAKVANWLVDVGGYVEQGAPVLELETDKVTMEVNAPVSGVLLTQEKQANDEIGEASVLGKLEAGEATNASLTNSSQVETATAQPLKIAEAGIRSSRHLIGPAVRRLLDENKLNIEQISGSGLGGRVTKNDVIEFVNVAASTKKTNEVAAHSSS